MEEQVFECKGCGKSHLGQFCNFCGQKVITEKISFRKIFNNLFTAIFNVDRGIIHTLRELTLRPGTVANDYLHGKTKVYFNPLSFLIVAITITVLIGQATGLYETQLEQMNAQNFEGKSAEYIEMQQTLQSYLGRFLNLLIFTSLPGMSILSYWVFRKKGLFLSEHFVVNCYFYGYTLYVTLLFIPVQIAFSSPFVDLGLGAIISITYLSWAYKDWLKYSTLGAIIRSFTIFIFGFLLVMLFFIIIVALIAIILKLYP